METYCAALVSFLRALMPILQALTPVVTACIAVYIAYQQYKLNKTHGRIEKERLKLDLYSKKYAIFNAVRKFILSITREGDVKDSEYNEFMINTVDKRFLFDDEVISHINKVKSEALKLKRVKGRMSIPSMLEHEERAKLIKEDDEIIDWFCNQEADLTNKYAKHLKFDEIG